MYINEIGSTMGLETKQVIKKITDYTFRAHLNYNTLKYNVSLSVILCSSHSLIYTGRKL